MENSMESSLAEQQRILSSDWGGGKSPFGTSWSKFMMWIFIISDALTFAGFLIAYGFMRSISPEWPKQTEVFNMVLITFMTFMLISSSATMAMAVVALEEISMNVMKVIRTMLKTSVCFGHSGLMLRMKPYAIKNPAKVSASEMMKIHIMNLLH